MFKIICLLFSLQCFALDKVVVFGNSLTAGFLSYSKMLTDNSANRVDWIEFPFVLDAIQLLNSKRLSWAITVANEYGLNDRDVLNYAYTAGLVRDVEKQLKDAVRDLSRHPGAETYLFVEIGANDACKYGPEPDYKQFEMDVNYIYSKIREHGYLFKKVFILDIPPLWLVRSLNEEPSFTKHLSCKSLRTNLGRLCSNLIDSDIPNEAVHGMIERYNSIIELHAKLNGFLYLDVFKNIKKLNKEWMAADCFHLSKIGQKELGLFIKRKSN